MSSAFTSISAVSRPITVVLADDHNILREGLRLLLESTAEIQVIGEAENGLQAVKRVKDLIPDIVILDLAMPILNGKDAARQILKAVPQTKVLILSSYADDQHVQDLIQTGVAGYLLKQSAAPEIIRAVHEVKKGNRFFSEPIAKRLSTQARKGATAHRPIEEVFNSSLTPREIQVLQLIAEGYPNKGIAPILGISIKTVEKHRQQVMDKLNLHDIASLTRYAIAQGMIRPPGSGALPSA
jgi:DNA-binding NarL/FixJ family response regulator